MQTDVIRDTAAQWDEVIKNCRNIFLQKTKDYGSAWRVLRSISIIDQIYIKAYRIRTIQENKSQKIEDNVASEFIGIINYAVIGNIQLLLSEDTNEDLNPDEALPLYDEQVKAAHELMMNKNHDYGEAWRAMSQESFTDLILMKLQRMKQILVNKGETLISEGLDANYFDILNYAVFALILINEEGKQ